VSRKPPPPKTLALIDRRPELKSLVQRVRTGELPARAKLFLLLDRPEVARCFLDLAGRVRHAWLEAFAGGRPLDRDLVGHELARLRTELLGPTPAASERLVVERVVAGWMHLNEADLRLAAAGAGRASEFLQRRLDHAHRRFFSALKALGGFRRPGVPAVQVNIAEQQLNVASP
jgi:hypothetical protein